MYQENTHWRKEAMIGAGMFGECYQALDVLSGTLMAVKRVQKYLNCICSRFNVEVLPLDMHS